MFKNNPLANKRVMESTWRCILYHTKLLRKQKPMEKNLNKPERTFWGSENTIRGSCLIKSPIVNQNAYIPFQKLYSK